VIAHVAGLPVEETLLPLLTGVSAGLLLARAWIVRAWATDDWREMDDGADRPPAG
jgi:hypothetical protein